MRLAISGPRVVFADLVELGVGGMQQVGGVSHFQAPPSGRRADPHPRARRVQTLLKRKAFRRGALYRVEALPDPADDVRRNPRAAPLDTRSSDAKLRRWKLCASSSKTATEPGSKPP